MVKSVGMREFKNRFNEIVRGMEDSCQPVVVTRRGVEVFRAVPLRRPHRMTPEEIEQWNARMDDLASRISDLWPKEQLPAKGQLSSSRGMRTSLRARLPRFASFVHPNDGLLG